MTCETALRLCSLQHLVIYRNPGLCSAGQPQPTGGTGLSGHQHSPRTLDYRRVRENLSDLKRNRKKGLLPCQEEFSASFCMQSPQLPSTAQHPTRQGQTSHLRTALIPGTSSKASCPATLFELCSVFFSFLLPPLPPAFRKMRTERKHSTAIPTSHHTHTPLRQQASCATARLHPFPKQHGSQQPYTLANGEMSGASRETSSGERRGTVGWEIPPHTWQEHEGIGKHQALPTASASCLQC